MNRFLAITAAFLTVAGSAQASEKKEEKKEEGGQYVAISPVALPVIVGGKVVNYVFVSVRVELSPSANASKLRDREPYFRDALVRAAHRTPFTLPSDLTKIDEAKLKAAVLRDATVLAGPGAVRGVTIVSQAPKTLRVSQR